MYNGGKSHYIFKQILQVMIQIFVIRTVFCCTYSWFNTLFVLNSIFTAMQLVRMHMENQLQTRIFNWTKLNENVFLK